MNASRPRTQISLAKSWQSNHGSLVIQCSVKKTTSDSQDVLRQKGFLILDPHSPRAPVSFATEKPPGELSPNGLAAILRKHCAASSFVGLALSHDQSSSEFIRLRLLGTSSAGDSTETFILVATKPEKEISVVVASHSLARLQAKALFTVKKNAPVLFLDIIDLEVDGWNAWLESCFGEASQPSSRKIATNEDLSSEKYSTDASAEMLSPLRRQARDRMARRLKTLKKTLAQDQKNSPSTHDLQQAKKLAAHLASYLWLVKSDMTELRLDAAQTGDEPCVIDLDPELSPGANLERHYAHVKKLGRGMTMQGPRIEQIKQQINRFETALDKIRNANCVLSDGDVETILTQLGLTKASPSGSRLTVPKKTWIGRRFMSSQNIAMTIGRDSDESDRLVKIAKSSDWWLHIAGGGHGSHVIVSGISSKDSLPAATMRESAILALHFSERSTSREGEVYCTRRQFIRKRKGMPAGLWQVERSESMVIRYEPEELAVIFSREIRDGIQRHQVVHHVDS